MQDLVGVSKAKMMVIADDNPAMAHRTTSVARQLNPTMRIVVRTRYIADAEHLTEAGADVVIAEELESIVQLFGEVLRDYRIAADQIENYEDLARRNGYSALLQTPQDRRQIGFQMSARRRLLRHANNYHSPANASS
jgi:CPA2 family monovalent cation:H+ antiporter-2